MPCFNEGKKVYETIESISRSNYPNERFEVTAQDDCSVDDSYEWMLKAQRDFANVRIRTGRNEFNSGKARTVCNALQHSSADIIVSIDSDCIFHPLKELAEETQSSESDEQKALDRVTRQNNWDVVLTVGVHQQVNPADYGPQPYGEVSVTYNLASRAIDRHLDRAVEAHAEWKKVQEGDIVRQMDVLRQQLVDSVKVQEAKLESFEEQSEEIEKDLQTVAAPDTSAGFDFHNQLAATLLLLQIETADARFRIARLQEYLTKNY
jgi:glycosyltransferase involved in cell wall biosynthesis